MAGGLEISDALSFVLMFRLKKLEAERMKEAAGENLDEEKKKKKK